MVKIREEFMEEDLLEKKQQSETKQKFLERENTDLLMENSYLKEQNKNLENEVEEIRRQLTQVRRQSHTRSAQGQITEELETKYKQLREKNFETKSELAEANRKLKQMEHDNMILKEDLETLQEQLNQKLENKCEQMNSSINEHLYQELVYDYDLLDKFKNQLSQVIEQLQEKSDSRRDYSEEN